MRKFSLLVIALSATAFSNAALFDVTTALDTFVNNGSTTNANRAYKGNAGITSNSASTPVFKFLSSGFPSDLAGSTITELNLTYYTTVLDPNTSFEIFFSPDATWDEGGNTGGVAQDPATTPFLVYNDTNLPGATNPRFLGNAVLVGSDTFATNTGVLNTVHTTALANNPTLINAIKSGSNFSIFLRDVTGRITVIALEGVAGTAGSQAVHLTGTYQPVPEPATFGVMAVGALGLLRRRRK